MHKQLKSILSKEDYQTFRALLVAYKDKEITAESLIDQLQQLFDNIKYYSLMRLVVPYLPSRHRQEALVRADSMEEQYAMSELLGVDGENVPAVKLPTSNGASLIRKIHTYLAVKCSVCKEKPRQPFSANCKHVACHACWLDWLKSNDVCPECAAPTRSKHLSKLFFC